MNLINNVEQKKKKKEKKKQVTGYIQHDSTSKIQKLTKVNILLGYIQTIKENEVMSNKTQNDGYI